MNTLIAIVAWVSLVLTSITVLAMPLMIGRQRKEYGYGDFIRVLLELAIMILLVGRVLNWF